MKKLFVLFLVGLCLFSITAAAQEVEDPINQVLDETLTKTESINVPGFDFNQIIKKALGGTLDFRFDTLIHKFFSLLVQDVQANIGLLIKILALAILAGVLCNLQQNLAKGSVAEISFLACFASIAGLSVTILAGINRLAGDTISNMMLLIAGFMPIMGSLTASASGIAISGFYPGMFVAMQTFVSICQNILLPAIMVISALSVVNAVSGRFHITRLLDVARQMVKWCLGLLLTIFVGILGVHSFTANASVSIAGRTVRYALCNFVPLVGNVLAESAEAVISSVRVVRGAVGVAGAIGLIVLCSVPLIKILATSVLYRFTAGIAEPVTDGRIVRLLMDLSGSISLTFSILLMVAVMFIISIALLCSLII
ncbi:MAG: stage III sporulation protein AE [Clostridia bacterium]|nr:stage III sporulation protein AE [Clostridia bacterium]